MLFKIYIYSSILQFLPWTCNISLLFKDDYGILDHNDKAGERLSLRPVFVTGTWKNILTRRPSLSRGKMPRWWKVYNVKTNQKEGMKSPSCPFLYLLPTTTIPVAGDLVDWTAMRRVTNLWLCGEAAWWYALGSDHTKSLFDPGN